MSLLLSLGLFPACGHHRAVASVALAKETKNVNYKMWNVKVIAPPAGKEWDERIRTLGYFDNLPFGTRLSLKDKLVFMRRDWTANHADQDGNWKEPVDEHKATFRTYLRTYLGGASNQTLYSWQGLIGRPVALWHLVLKIMDANKVQNKQGEEFKPLKAPNSVHAIAALPNDQFTDIMNKIVARKLSVRAANDTAKKLKAICNCREHIIFVARSLHPQRTAGFEDWAHYTELWPSFNDLAFRHQAFFAAQKGRKKRNLIPGFNTKIRQTIEFDDEVRAGRASARKLEASDLPFLKVSWRTPKSSLRCAVVSISCC